MKRETDAQLAKLTEHGRLGRTLPIPPFVIPASPSLELLEGDPHLVWNPEGEYRTKDFQDRGILRDFMQLAEEEDPELVLRFAERYGPLYLCEHDLPASHSAEPPDVALGRMLLGGTITEEVQRREGRPEIRGLRGLRAGGHTDTLNSPVGGQRRPCGPTGAEPIHVWRRFADQVRSLLDISARVYGAGGSARPGTTEQWAKIAGEEVGAGGSSVVSNLVELNRLGPPGTSVENDRTWLALRVRFLLVLTDVRLWFEWDRSEESPGVTLDGFGALAGVARQLAFVVGRRTSLKICEDCGAIFEPTHLNQKYCPDCRGADRARARRQKKNRRKKQQDS